MEAALHAFEKMEPILEELSRDEDVPSEGLPYLEAKTETLLGYCANLCYYIILKSTPGAEIPTALFEQLFKQRWLLQRAKPLDQRMKYSIEKLLKEWKAPDTTPAPAPGSLRMSITDDAEAEISNTGDNKKYSAPRFQAVEAPVKETKKDKLEKLIERKKKRFEQGEMMRELRAEFVDAPIQVGGSGRDAKGSLELEALERKAEHKKQYEEDNFVRLMPTKKDKKEAKRLRALQGKSQNSGVASLNDIADISNLMEQDKRLGELQEARALKRQREKGKPDDSVKPRKKVAKK